MCRALRKQADAGSVRIGEQAVFCILASTHSGGPKYVPTLWTVIYIVAVNRSSKWSHFFVGVKARQWDGDILPMEVDLTDLQ